MREETIETRQLCAAPHRDTPPEPEPGALLCHRCRTRLRRTIVDVADLWSCLDDLLTSRNGHGSRGDGAPPLRLEILRLLDERGHHDGTNVAGILLDWSELVAEERGFGPVPRHPVRHAVAAALARLETHHRWCATRPWIIDMIAELGTVRAHLRHAAGETPERIATCHAPHLDPQVLTPCGGALVRDHVGSGLVCTTCHDRWTDRDLVGLREIHDRHADTPDAGGA